MSRAKLTRTVEGPQRRMPRHLFSVLSILLLLLLGCACGPARAWDNGPMRSISMFVPGRMTRHESANGSFVQTNVSSFASPFLAGGNGVMVALAEARFSEGGNDEFDAVFGLIDTEEPNWTHKITENNGSDWGIQWIHRARAGNHYAIRSPTAVIKGNKIYMFALTNEGPHDSIVSGHWYILMGVGEIMGLPVRNIIQWKKSASLRSKLMREIKNKGLSVFPGSSNSAFLTSKGRVVFSLNATNKESEPGFAVMQLKDGTKQWGVSFVNNSKKCRHFFLFEWKEKLINILSGCPHGTYYAREFDEMNEKWRDAEDSFFHGWGSGPRLGGLTSVSIENKTVLLFTEKCHSQRFANGTSEIPLWFTDGTRVGQAGEIYTLCDKAASGRFVYTNGELYLLHHQNSDGRDAIVLTRLNEQLKRIMSVSKTWDAKDAYLSKPCNETAPEGASPDTFCVTPMPTDGLVALLSDYGNEFYWYAEYDFVHAFVRGRKVKNGYTFSDAYEGLLWLVSSGRLIKGCTLAKCGMTVVATMIVHETPRFNASLLTVEGQGLAKCLGLWYTGGQWKMVSDNGDEEPAIDLETQKEYRMALVIKNNTISVYVDGNSLGIPQPTSAPGEEPFDITNVRIGGFYRRNGINMTVTNIFLYSRALNDTELMAASKRVAPAQITDPEDSTEQAIGKAAGDISETSR